MKVIFARHGESTANTLHIFSNNAHEHPLTEKGQAQALDLAARLKGVPITAVYSSRILRAVETAGIVCQQLGLTFTVTDALREFDFGDFEGASDQQHWDEFSQLWEAWFRYGQAEKNVGGGENLLQIRQRMKSFLALLRKTHQPDDTILCISHGGFLIAGLPGQVENLEIGQLEKKPLGNTEMVILQDHGENWRCLQWAERLLE